MSKFAVIIPLYNHARYIAETLDSVLAQTEPPRRVLVLDDGSTDNSVEIARNFGDRVEVHTQENRGAHNTLNTLVEMAADCEYVAILNSDDRFLPGRLVAGAEYLAAHPLMEAVCTPFQIIGTEGAALPEEHPRTKWFRAAWSCRLEFEGGALGLAAWLGRANFPGTTSNIMARREYLRAHPFRDYRYIHDYFFLLQAALEGVLGLLPTFAPLLEYRVHENNTISTAPRKLTTELVRMVADLRGTLAPMEDPALRIRWAELENALYANISGIHAGCVERIAAGADPAEFPELDNFPNREIVNRWDGQGSAWGDRAIGHLATELAAQRDLRAQSKEEAAALKELSQLRADLGKSRWVALGTILGPTRKLARDEGKTAVDKLANLRQRLNKSTWPGLRPFRSDH